jgi:hypothetical protein
MGASGQNEGTVAITMPREPASSLLCSFVPGTREPQLQFGDKLALADLNGDGSCEVIVGCPLGHGSAADEGRVCVTQLRDDSSHNEVASLLLTQSDKMMPEQIRDVVQRIKNVQDQIDKFDAVGALAPPAAARWATSWSVT